MVKEYKCCFKHSLHPNVLYGAKLQHYIKLSLSKKENHPLVVIKPFYSCFDCVVSSNLTPVSNDVSSGIQRQPVKS